MGVFPFSYKDRQAHEAFKFDWDGDPTKLTDSQLATMEDTWRRAALAARKVLAAGGETIDLTAVE